MGGGAVTGPGAEGRAALAALLAIASGCAAAKPPAPRPEPAPLLLEIAAGKATNQGGPLYVAVRKCDGAGFLAEDYDAIAESLFRSPRDPALLRKAIVHPGEVVRLEVPRELSDGEVLGVYFLFSAPGDRWRLSMDDPRTQAVSVVLGAWGIESVERRP
jgi:predicted component of type VI protein secretion system